MDLCTSADIQFLGTNLTEHNLILDFVAVKVQENLIFVDLDGEFGKFSVESVDLRMLIMIMYYITRRLCKGLWKKVDTERKTKYDLWVGISFCFDTEAAM